MSHGSHCGSRCYQNWDPFLIHAATGHGSQKLGFLLRPLFQDGKFWVDLRKEEVIETQFGIQIFKDIVIQNGRLDLLVVRINRSNQATLKYTTAF